MSGNLLRPCKSKAAFEAIPASNLGRLNLDLENCGNKLHSLAYEKVCNAKVLIIMKKEIEITIYPTGKLLLKTDSYDLAQQKMNEIYETILPK